MRKVLSNEKIHQDADLAMAQFHPDIVIEIEKALASHEWVVVGMAQNPVVTKARKVLDSKAVQFHYIEHGSYFSGWKLR
jgi:monothiol glutaredoxin